VAVLVVLLFHLDLAWIPGGFLGVSTFFTLSGFLITGLLVSEHANSGAVSLRRF
jgi:peptidoglycan/LPS O-acetylase OafA/YrhL